MTKYTPKIWAVIPAAGVGSRMESDTPKQYMQLFGQYLIEITIKKILQLTCVDGIVVVLSAEDAYWQTSYFTSNAKVHRVEGGSERSDSVLNGLEYCRSIMSDQDYVHSWALVHDAARPCVTEQKMNELIARGLSFAETFSETTQNTDNLHLKKDNNLAAATCGTILASPVADTVKRVSSNEQIERTEDRSQLWLAHTPQFFPTETLSQALHKCRRDNIAVTDEASAIEAVGGRVAVVKDRRDNIKITVPEDLYWAETILKMQGFK